MLVANFSFQIGINEWDFINFNLYFTIIFILDLIKNVDSNFNFGLFYYYRRFVISFIYMLAFNFIGEIMIKLLYEEFNYFMVPVSGSSTTD